MNLGSASSITCFIVGDANSLSQTPLLSPRSTGLHSLRLEGCGLHVHYTPTSSVGACVAYYVIILFVM